MMMEQEPGRRRGIVRWFSRLKGYGFIQAEDDQDIFVYLGPSGSDRSSLSEGQRVEFDMEDGKKGPQARDLSFPD
jgi:CspA family cold shock protein